jgi:Protein of unknown function (DUF2934)
MFATGKSPPYHQLRLQVTPSKFHTFGILADAVRAILHSSRTLPCTNLRELTGYMFRRSFAPNGGSPMSIDATTKRSATMTSEPQELELEQIRLRAYELYEARGRKHGHELDDWLRAKEEIREKEFRTATA